MARSSYPWATTSSWLRLLLNSFFYFVQLRHYHLPGYFVTSILLSEALSKVSRCSKEDIAIWFLTWFVIYSIGYLFVIYLVGSVVCNLYSWLLCLWFIFSCFLFPIFIAFSKLIFIFILYHILEIFFSCVFSKHTFYLLDYLVL